MTEIPAAPAMPVKQALIMLLIIIVLLAAYVAIGTALAIKSLYAGFFFLLYWAGIRHSAPREYLPALIGALAGIGMGYILYLATPYGLNALLAAVGLILVAVFLDLVRWVPMVINTAFMLFLTLAAAPPVQAAADFTGLVAGLLLSAGFFGAIILGVGWVQERKQRGVAI